MKGRSIPYSADELAWLEENKEFSRRELHRLFVMFFDRPDVTADQIKALCTRKGWKTGRTGCFEKGETPHNKGKPNPAAATHPNCRKGHFTKGERRGVAVKLYKPIGTERVSEDGYLERKIHDGMPLQSRWKLVHRIEWEAANGPVPKGHALKCLDGNKLNTSPANWELISRAMLPRLAGGNRYKRTLAFDDASPEVRPSLLAIAKLEHRVRDSRRMAETGTGSGRRPTSPVPKADAQDDPVGYLGGGK